MIPIVVSTTELRPPEVQVKQFKQIVRESLVHIAQFWHTKILPQHFMPHAAAKYGYKRRSGRWVKRKAALAKHGVGVGDGRQDLVFRGMLKQHVTTMATIRASATRATLSMRGRAFVQINLKSSKQPDYRTEITKHSPDETARLHRLQTEFIRSRLDALRDPKTTRAA